MVRALVTLQARGITSPVIYHQMHPTSVSFARGEEITIDTRWIALERLAVARVRDRDLPVSRVHSRMNKSKAELRKRLVPRKKKTFI